MIQVQLKLRMTKTQERLCIRWLHRLTGVYNWALRKIEYDRSLTAYDLKRLLKGHSAKVGIPVYALGGTVVTAHLAWKRVSMGLARKPRLKGNRRPLSSIAFDHWDSVPRKRRVTVPGVGAVKFHAQDIPAGRISSGRIVRRASGWYLCLFVHAEPSSIPRVSEGSIGIDPGFLALATLSNGEQIEHPHELKRRACRLGQAQRGRRRKLTARLHERVARLRRDRNHKLSRRLVSENTFIAFSADQHSNIARAFGKSVASAGHHQLRMMLRYKSLAGGTQYIEVPSRNSTRTCSACGALTGPAAWNGLKVRQWVCTTCGVIHGRDHNAAVNTLKAGLAASLKGGREAASGIAI